MKTTHLVKSLIATGLLTSTLVQATEYLPAVSGNHYTYQSTGFDGGVKYSQVIQGFNPSLLTFSDFLGQGQTDLVMDQEDSSKIWVQPSNSREEKLQLFIDFDAPADTTWDVNLNPCVNRVSIVEKGLTVETAAGVFSDVVRVQFSGYCRDGGLAYADFAKGVGPIRWTEQTILGENEYELAAAKVHSDAPQVVYPHAAKGLTLKANQAEITKDYAGNPRLVASLMLQNNSDQSYTMTYFTPVEYIIELIDQDGAMVKTSNPNPNLMILHFDNLNAKDYKYYSGELNVSDVPAGHYTLRTKINGSLGAASGHKLVADMPVEIK